MRVVMITQLYYC